MTAQLKSQAHIRETRQETDRRSLLRVPIFLLQPILHHIVERIAVLYPEIFERLGPHQLTRFVIDPVNLPFALCLIPKPGNLIFRACYRDKLPSYDARISGKFLDLLRLVDCDEDGDAMFFSREIDVTGNTEAVVTLRNALDNVEGSIASSVADMFGPPGRGALTVLRRLGARPADRNRGKSA